MKKIRPKISTVYPFDYADMIAKAKFAYLDAHCGNTGSELRPMVIMGDDKFRPKSQYWGFEIDTYRNGICQSGEVHGIDKKQFEGYTDIVWSEDVESIITGWLLIVQCPDLLKLPLINL